MSETISKKPRRLNVDLTANQEQLFRTLMELSGCSTKTELVNQALTFFSWGLNAAYKGEMIASVDQKHDRYRELQMPALNHASIMGEREREKAA